MPRDFPHILLDVLFLLVMYFLPDPIRLPYNVPFVYRTNHPSRIGLSVLPISTYKYVLQTRDTSYSGMGFPSNTLVFCPLTSS